MKIFLILCVITVCLLNPAQAAAQTDKDDGAGKLGSIAFSASSELDGSGAYYIDQSDFNYGFETWFNGRIAGTLGKSVSYFADIGVALISAKRKLLGAEEIMVDSTETVKLYSKPLGYFPYTYQSGWGGFVFPLTNLGATGPTGWPDEASIGFTIISEIKGSAINDIVKWSIGRTKHEAASPVEGSSLALNMAAQPFFAYDLDLNLFPGFHLYSLTGMLEYFSSVSIYSSPMTFQNAFSLFQVSYNFREYFQIDAGSSAVWLKRFELAYLYPFTIPILYKNIGEFDNMAIFGSLKLQWPKIGFVWFSLFVDEMNMEKNFFNLDREMYALQAGLRYFTPFLSSGFITLSYTKIEPYCYTHEKVASPWYANNMEQAYVNHGYGLGYYLPPNSDELKLAFSANATPNVAVSAQYQMIRHGAEYGSSKVYGSSYASELQPVGRSDNLQLRKFFLHDGAYQWMHIIKVAGEWKLSTRIPISLYGEGGTVISYFTDIEPGKAKTGAAYPNSVTDTAEYPKSNALILHIGFKVSTR